MGKPKIAYGRGDIGKVKVEKDFLPPPEFLEFFQKMSSVMEHFVHSFEKSFAPVATTLVRWAITQKQCDLLEAAGWLPHYTTPFDLIGDAVVTQENIGPMIEQFYADNWADIRGKFECKIASYDIFPMAKEAFSQALIAHEHRLYPLVPRGLFPEIERVTRDKLYDGPIATVTDPKKLKEHAGGFPLSVFELGGLFGLKLYEKLIDHLYRPVTKSTHEQICSDPVPNRHAAIHGYLSYNSAQSSLNALIMADYVFQILSCVAPRSTPVDDPDSSIPS